jgi:competence protein ComEC
VARRAPHRRPLAPALEGRDLVVVGTVASLPQQGASGLRFRFESSRRCKAARRCRCRSRVALGWYKGFHEDATLSEPQRALRAGQRWRFVVRLRQPHGSLNPHGTDYELSLFEQGVRATGYVRDGPAELLDPAAGFIVERGRQRVRDAIEASVADRRAAGVLAALAVGDQGAIDRDDWDLFRNTGVAHLMSISGLHVTMFAWLAGVVVALLWRLSPARCCACRCRSRLASAVSPRHSATRSSRAGACRRSARSGCWRPSCCCRRPGRALALAAGAAARGRGRHRARPVGAAAAGLLAVVHGGRAADGFVADRWPRPRRRRERRTLRPLAAQWDASRICCAARCAPQVIATLGLAPLTLVFFQQVSLVGFAANLFAIPARHARSSRRSRCSAPHSRRCGTSVAAVVQGPRRSARLARRGAGRRLERRGRAALGSACRPARRRAAGAAAALAGACAGAAAGPCRCCCRRATCRPTGSSS